ncbi:hypothetical protein, partial [Vibrio anguillarum]
SCQKSAQHNLPLQRFASQLVTATRCLIQSGTLNGFDCQHLKKEQTPLERLCGLLSAISSASHVMSYEY